MKKIAFTIYLLLFALLCTGLLSGATLTVDDSGPADYSTIQSAINAAAAGDTVFVYPGTYNERIYLKDGVRVNGSGPESTIIDGAGLYRQVVLFTTAGEAEISGFTITGSSTYASWTTCGIYCGNGRLTISGNVITGNYCGIAIVSGKPNIINNTITGNFNGIIAGSTVSAPPAPATCYSSLPAPKIAVSGVEDVSGGTRKKYSLRVTNWYSFPNDLFASAPSLPPCGANTNASRTWVNIYDQDNHYLYGFCALSSAQSLYNSLWFSVDATNIPEEIYIRLEDRQCGKNYTSNSVSPDSEPSDYTIMNNVIASNSHVGIFFYHYNQSGKISYNNVWGNPYRNYHNNFGGVSFTPWPGDGEISADPVFVDTNFHLDAASPSIDAGHPGSIYNDMDGTRNDQGAYGGFYSSNGPGSHSGNGFLFTSIGKIPVSEVNQNALAADFGLTTVDASLASEYGIPAYKNSPFGGKLWLHGLFGEAAPDSSVKYYQILVAKWNGSTPPGSSDYVALSDPLSKVRYTVNTDGSVNYERVSLGPQSRGSYDNLYELTKSGYWTHIDLRMIWDTRSWEDGKYTIKYRAYEEVMVYWGYWVPQPVTLFDNAQDEITLVVDNRPVEVEIKSVKYESGITIPECGIIDLSSDTDNLIFQIKATHPGGYLGGYSLTATYGKNKSAGTIGSDVYAGVHDATPLWFGETNREFHSWVAMKKGTLIPWKTCAYRFHLYAWSRSTDGYHYIYDASFNDHYYIDAQSCRECLILK